LQVVRAHRLWETYLLVEAKMPLARLHKAAERAEHSLTAERLEELDATLGHPARDPHGDPIPSASGDLKPLEATPLTDWPVGLAGQVVHIEDEPASVFQKIPSEALRPGVAVRVLERGAEHIRISDGEREFDLPPAIAANVHLTSVGGGGPSEGVVPLSELQVGEEAEMVAIDGAIQGFSRRRLLDLGLTPGARIQPHLDNVFGDPRAFRVRGTTIALRAEQASKIWVRRPAEQRVEAR
jgi:DtxR family Mn-dependent transcriptional regulator